MTVPIILTQRRNPEQKKHVKHWDKITYIVTVLLKIQHIPKLTSKKPERRDRVFDSFARGGLAAAKVA